MNINEIKKEEIRQKNLLLMENEWKQILLLNATEIAEMKRLVFLEKIVDNRTEQARKERMNKVKRNSGE